MNIYELKYIFIMIILNRILDSLKQKFDNKYSTILNNHYAIKNMTYSDDIFDELLELSNDGNRQYIEYVIIKIYFSFYRDNDNINQIIELYNRMIYTKQFIEMALNDIFGIKL